MQNNVLSVTDLLQLYMKPAVVAMAERAEEDLLKGLSEFDHNLIVEEPQCS